MFYLFSCFPPPSPSPHFIVLLFYLSVLFCECCLFTPATLLQFFSFFSLRVFCSPCYHSAVAAGAVLYMTGYLILCAIHWLIRISADSTCNGLIGASTGLPLLGPVRWLRFLQSIHQLSIFASNLLLPNVTTALRRDALVIISPWLRVINTTAGIHDMHHPPDQDLIFTIDFQRALVTSWDFAWTAGVGAAGRRPIVNSAFLF